MLYSQLVNLSTNYLGTISGYIPDDLEKRFRQKALDLFGGKKGSIEKALEKAITEWVS